jgi:hypothetical protein
MPVERLPDEADPLYGLPLPEFVAARDELARRLRREGARDDAVIVAKLRRPSAAAWAVNQVVRTQRAAARELWAAGDALLDAQQRLVSGGGSATELRAAAARERDAVEALGSAAAGLLDPTGRAPSRTTLERVHETLHAAALEPDVRERAAAGRLESEHRHIGLGGAVGTGPARAAGPAPAPSPERGEPPDRDRELEERERRERRRRLRDAVTAAEADLEGARAALADADASVRQARREADEAQERLDGAQRRAGGAAEAEQRAQAAHEAAVRALREDG